ncbi:MAG: hypothetical protein OSA84_10935 [Akkermansiaceae bacterium]|nr:hypothetical protein [Akkermansiaceae bacterium]
MKGRIPVIAALCLINIAIANDQMRNWTFASGQKIQAEITDNNPEREAEMLQRFTAILPQIEAAVPHDEKRMFMGGTSGGAWRSYHYSAQVPRPWAGILASGGWLGGEQWYDLPYPRMRVAMVNGDKDYAAIGVMKKDTEVLHRADSVVSVHAFEGGHQMPPPSVLTKALRWLLETELPAESAP